MPTMSELGEELRRNALARQRAESGVHAGDAPVVMERAQKRRSRRMRFVGSAGVVGVLALGAGAWMLAPEPPLPAMQVADGVVSADVPPIPPQFQGLSCFERGIDPYVPWAEPGVTLSSEDVRNLGIRVDATAFLMDWGTETRTAEEVEPGTPVTLAAPEDYLSRNLVGVQFDVSWDGDALYQVDATAIATSGGRVVSALGGWGTEELWGEEPPEFIAEKTSIPGRSAVSLASFPDYVSCALSVPGSSGEAGDAPVPAGELELHTLVQIKSEAGQPLATFVDALGLDGTTLRYDDGKPEEPLEIAPIEPSELEAQAAQRSRLEPVKSFEATMRDALEVSGAPLREIGVGFIPSGHYCAVPEIPLLDQIALPLVDDSADQAGSLAGVLPAELPLSTLTRQGVVELDIDQDSPMSPGSIDSQLVFLDERGSAVALQAVYYGSTGNVATLDFEDWNGCSDIDGLEVGRTYEVVSLPGGVDLSALETDLREAFEQTLSFEITMAEHVGEVTIAE